MMAASRYDSVMLRNYIGGSLARGGAGVEELEDVDPATGEVAALVPLCGAREVGEAVEAARGAQPGWRAVPPQRRARAVLALREGLEARREELAALVTADMGKTLADADGEVGRGIESVESAAAVPHLLKGEILEGVAAGVDVEMVRQPVGVVAAITPFNFPAMIPLWFLPYAIACGNSFLLKPSEQDPRPAALIMEIVDSVGEIPPGVVNLVHGGRDAVEAILADPGIDAVSFVGRAETARDRRRRRGADRQAGTGARRRQELARRHARRRPRPGAPGDHGLGLRRRRPALPGGFGLRRRRRRGAAGRGARRAGRSGL